jgi:N-acetyl-gamma-glutamyl-phosphate reductase
VSGAGRKAEVDILFSEASDNFKAYAVRGHRHHPEIMESLASLEGVAGRQLGLTFVPHLVPMVRGILATVYARITAETDFQGLYERRYEGEPFVDVMPPGPNPRPAGSVARTSAASRSTVPWMATLSSSWPSRTTW